MPTLIILGGLQPSPSLAQTVAAKTDQIIAADSGYDHCLACGIKPDVVTGDFDSINSLTDSIEATVIPAHEQTATDFEKALRQVPDRTRHILVLGGTGLRSDHFLTNLLIAAGRPDHEQIQFLDDSQTIHRVTAACPLLTTCQPGTIVSLIPFTDCTSVTTAGLRWNLHSADMGPRKQLGQSNEASAASLRVELSSGTLYVVQNHSINHS